MDQRIQLIQADPNNFSIDRIYSILWYTISKTKDLSIDQNIFICPHTVQIELQNNDQISYQPQSCNICSQTQYRAIQRGNRYKYMICGILYFLLEGNNTLEQYYQSQQFFFFKNIYGYYNEKEHYLRSICQILQVNNFQQKQQIFDNMPEANRPLIKNQFQLTKYCVIIISPCLGTPLFRQYEENNAYYLLSFQNLLQDLRQISFQIGCENVPPPCLHNIFINQGYHHFCKFSINIFQTDPICRCQNNQMGTILYTLLTKEEYVDGNRRTGDLIIDDELILFSRYLINKYQFNSAQEQFRQYEKIIGKIDRFRSSNSVILGNTIDASFYANNLRRNLKHIQQTHLWNYYKILFLQEMIELLENRILSQLQYYEFLFGKLFQLKLKQIQSISAYLQHSSNQLLSEILQNYSSQCNPLAQIEQQQHQIQENNIELPRLFVVRQILFESISNVNAFDDQQNQFFRNQFQAEFNYRTIIEFEEMLQSDLLQV
ncbi:unnamed protein product [Paramecium octaurelia]|uniref:Uncharacterized protein n=1 Tax=Paramecium octaurelia TaxID=43137 RepID=A0A8S1VEL8_PAROT|nr:unnamed protein product [Paramecium octaurelia]